MNKNFIMGTEGLLVIVSSNALKEKYANEAFDYNFPDGIEDLIKKNTIIAITNSNGDNLVVEFTKGNNIDIASFDRVIEQNLILTDNDELLILSHAEFTMICTKKGDYKLYGFPITFVKSISKGRHLIQIAINDVSDEFEKYNAYFKVTINLTQNIDDSIDNFICELWD